METELTALKESLKLKEEQEAAASKPTPAAACQQMVAGADSFAAFVAFKTTGAEVVAVEAFTKGIGGLVEEWKSVLAEQAKKEAEQQAAAKAAEDAINKRRKQADGTQVPVGHEEAADMDAES